MSRPGNLWRRVHGRIAKKPTNFSWVIPDMVAGSGIPTTREEFDWLTRQGIRCVVTMTEEKLPRGWTKDVSYLHVPTPDMTAPGPDEIDAAVDFMHRNIQSGSPAMVHCAAGLGRAGTILACYLIKYQDRTAQEAIREVRLQRPGSIQSETQEVAISMYQKHVR